MRMSVVLDCLSPDDLAPFWDAALGYRLVDQADGYRILVLAEGEPPGPVLILQPVAEELSGKNRMLLDVHPDDPSAHIRRLESLREQARSADRGIRRRVADHGRPRGA